MFFPGLVQHMICHVTQVWLHICISILYLLALPQKLYHRDNIEEERLTEKSASDTNS